MLKRFVLKRTSVANLMKSPEMVAVLEEKAKAVEERAGYGYEVSTVIGKRRATVGIKTKSRKAMRDNKKNNTLLKALHE